MQGAALVLLGSALGMMAVAVGAVVVWWRHRVQVRFWLWGAAACAVAAFAQISWGLHTMAHVATLEAVAAVFGLVGLWGTGRLRRPWPTPPPDTEPAG